jgi:hypothetical protein
MAFSQMTAAALAMSDGLAAAQAARDSANVSQPHLAAALALAALENSWHHRGRRFPAVDRAAAASRRAAVPAGRLRAKRVIRLNGVAVWRSPRLWN